MSSDISSSSTMARRKAERNSQTGYLNTSFMMHTHLTLKKKDMENRFIRAEDVAQELNVSKPYAYKLIRQLNEELKAKGFITIAGRVNRQYFYERLYGAGKGEM